jgi:hypothetical protein
MRKPVDSEKPMANRTTSRFPLSVEQLENRELLTHSLLNPAGLIARESFEATALNALPAAWSEWSSSGSFAVQNRQAVSGHNSLVASGSTGQIDRAWVNTSLAANVQVSADILVDSMIPGQVLARGSNLNSSTPTYYALSVARGLKVDLLRVVHGVSTTIGRVWSAGYLSGQWIKATLVVHGSTLEVQIYRTDRREYLNAHGRWQSAATFALVRTDHAISTGGLVGLARPSSHAGSVAFDDFKVVGVTPGPHRSSVVLRQSFDSTRLGTLPANWSQWTNQRDIGVKSTPKSGKALVSSGVTGEVERAWLNQYLPANVQASAAVFLDSLIPAQVFVRGVNLHSATPSFYAVSVTRGMHVQLLRIRNGVATVLGQASSRTYVSGQWITATIEATGSTLRAQIYRADRRQYLTGAGFWQSAPTWTIIRTDKTLPSGGRAGVARAAGPAGGVDFDNFVVVHAGPASTPAHVHATSHPRPAARPSVRPSTHRRDSTPPAIRITTPGNGSILTQPTIVHVAATDNTGVAHVDFYLDNVLVASDLNSPYDWVLDPSVVSDGVHHVMARAYDIAGNVSHASEVVTVRARLHPASPGINIPRHYTHIRIAELAYGGTPLDAAAQRLLRNSVDLVIPNPNYLSAIHRTTPKTPQLLYTNVSSLYQNLLTDWLNYAAAHGVSREDAFYHVIHATRFSGTSNSSQPVTWFWGVYADSGSASLTDYTAAAHNPFQGVPLGANGNSIYLGYTDKFREINFNLYRGARSGWTYVLEYTSAVDDGGNPTNWTALRTVTDTTAGLAHGGRLTFDPPPNWVTASLNGTNRLYYVRLRTISDGDAPVARTILGRDFVNAHGTNSGTIPAFDASADRDHDGYLNDAEYAHRRRGMDARFLFESRDFSAYGQERPATNPVDAAFRTWAVDFCKRLLKSHPLAAGLFIDNSSGRQPVNDTDVAESVSTYSRDYGALLHQIGKAIAPHWILANTAGGQTDADGVVDQNTSYYEEFGLRPLAIDYTAFEDLAAQVAHRMNLNPNGFAVLDSLPAGGSPTDPRTQIATLAQYYLLADPVRTFLDFYGGFAPSTSWSQHWSKAAAFNVGQPLGTWSLFATGHDPSNHALTYRVYERHYTNALILYKPLSHAPRTRARPTLGPASATTFNLNGKYRMLRADGALGGVVTRVTLRNGEGAILVKA